MRNVLAAFLLCLSVTAQAAAPIKQCPDAKENPLPLPSTIKPENFAAYEKQIFDFLDHAAH